MRRAAWRVLLAWVLLLVPIGSRATDNDFQLWPVGRVHHAINEDWSISFMARGRFDEDASHSKDYLLRPYVSWTLVDDVPFIDSLTVMAGYDYLHSFDGRDEHRAWQSAHHAVEHERPATRAPRSNGRALYRGRRLDDFSLPLSAEYEPSLRKLGVVRLRVR